MTRSPEEIREYLRERRNWGRWGDDDQKGTLNLITPEKRVEAMTSVRTGEVLSISRPVPTWSGAGNPTPTQHFFQARFHGGENYRHERPEDEPVAGSAIDFYGIPFHGVAQTHLDAISHVWDEHGMYNGRDPKVEFTFNGTNWGGVEQMSEGILTRGVLLDIPALRGVPYVEEGQPVMNEELERAAARQGVEVRPGDALLVYSGREKWQADHPDQPYGMYPIITDSRRGRVPLRKPGLDASCVEFIREKDVAALAWDMLDQTPFDDNLPYAVHGAIHAFGLALIDNALLEGLAARCAELGRYEFTFFVSPLLVNGGTGSPVNPLVIF